MTYIEIKKINGGLYKYKRRAIRRGSKIKKVYIKYLGPVNPKYKRDDKKK
jgi:hypothetical protein